MPWEWSHSPRAHANARINVEDMPKTVLRIVYAEWAAFDAAGGEDEGFDEAAYKKALRSAKKLDRDLLAEYVAERMERQARCEAGGFDAWMCPYGCDIHLVSFSDVANDKEVLKGDLENMRFSFVPVAEREDALRQAGWTLRWCGQQRKQAWFLE